MTYGLATVVIFGLVVVAAPSPAAAFTRSAVGSDVDRNGDCSITVTGDTTKPLWWRPRTIVLRAERPDPNRAPWLTEVEFLSALRDSMDQWNGASDGDLRCSNLQLIDGGAPSPGGDTSYSAEPDGENRIVWNYDWPDDRRDALAVTHTRYDRDTGEILDADIELNATHYLWTVHGDPDAETADLMNTLTHELGHLLGFAHSEHLDATMFACTSPGEISKRYLGDDDVDAVCTVYPIGAPTPRETGISQHKLISAPSCAMASPRHHRPLEGLSIAAVAAMLWRRSRRRAVRRAA